MTNLTSQMSDVTKRIDEITKDFSEEENELFLNSNFPYIISKADNLLSKGAEKYRSSDAFKLPAVEWTSQDLELIRNGCEQIMQGVGFMKDRPFTKLGVRGFNLLFTTFHFKSLKRKTNRLSQGKILDEITFEHAIDRSKVTYFNLVERE